jgi:hypothetical protein
MWCLGDVMLAEEFDSIQDALTNHVVAVFPPKEACETQLEQAKQFGVSYGL